jgi:galactofuranosylgalactofuranosylrhamnosyl-N-acetylglucosaminyl-diphospho-decaprenol beta-1,5/1,6-galactofuranosyltransferase
MLKESALQHAALYRNWDSLAADYRSALTDLVSMEAWRVSFDMEQETNLHH